MRRFTLSERQALVERNLRRASARRGPPGHLAFVFELAGAAVSLAFVVLATAVGQYVLDPPTAPRVVGFTVAVIGVVTALGLVPQLRQVEAVMANGLLGADLGEPPSPARTWAERLGSLVWFWLHLVAGVVNGVSLVMLGAGGVLATAAPLLESGTHILGLSVLTSGEGRDVRLVVLGPLMVGLCCAIALSSAYGLRRLAPRLLGPSLEFRLRQLQQVTDAFAHRQLLARELHDSLGHSLSAIVIQSALARRVLATAHPATAYLDEAEQSARAALQELDSFLGRLRAQKSQDELRVPSGPGLDDVPHLVSVAEAAGHRVTTELPTLDLPPVVSREVYRILQESITNVIRHAPGQPLRVEVRRDGRRLRLHVANPLPAATLATTASGSDAEVTRLRRGLLGVRERVRSLGGRAKVGPEAGWWTVHVTLPLARSDSSSSQERPGPANRPH